MDTVCPALYFLLPIPAPHASPLMFIAAESGIISRLTSALNRHHITIHYLSTYNTDYILVCLASPLKSLPLSLIHVIVVYGITPWSCLILFVQCIILIHLRFPSINCKRQSPVFCIISMLRLMVCLITTLFTSTPHAPALIQDTNMFPVDETVMESAGPYLTPKFPQVNAQGQEPEATKLITSPYSLCLARYAPCSYVWFLN